MGFFGFSAGIPILLIFSSLSLWLREAGVDRSAVTFFSWAALGYSFKFVWAPLVDQMPLPFLTQKFGRRRSWILFSQAAIMAAIAWMALIDPANPASQLNFMAMAAVCLGFSSATQDIAIDAYRIESAGEDLQAMMASAYIAGYRIGMITAGAGALFLADFFGSSKAVYSYSAWQTTYGIMAGFMIVGMMTALVIREPDIGVRPSPFRDSFAHARSFILFLLAAAGFVAWFYFTRDLSVWMKSLLGEWSIGHLAGFIVEALRLVGGLGTAIGIAWTLAALGIVDRDLVKASYVEPVSDFFSRYGGTLAWLLLALIGLYRISDIVLGVISNLYITSSLVKVVSRNLILLCFGCLPGQY